MGGKAPRVLSITPVKEITVPSSGKIVYLYKALIKRSSGDKNGQLVLFKAKNYGAALDKLLMADNSINHVVNVFFPYSILGNSFPDVKMNYDYTIEIKKKDGTSLGKALGLKKPKGKKKFIRYFSQGLEPGKYIIILKSEVKLGSHPLLSLYKIADWAKFLYKLTNPALLATEWFTKTGFAKKAAKQILKDAKRLSVATWQLNVLAKVPDLFGSSVEKAKTALSNRNLKWKIKETSKCNAWSAGRVFKQSPAFKTKVSANKVVKLTVCKKKSSISITPSSPSGGSSQPLAYSVYNINAGPNLFVGAHQSLEGRTPYSFKNGGLDNSSQVTYSILSGPYSSLSSAQKALCANIKKAYWSFSANCTSRYYWKNNTTWHAGCEPSVQTAINQYCPEHRF